MAVCFLAVAGVTKKWNEAKENTNLKSRAIITFVNEHFEEKMLKYAQLRAQQDYVKDKKMSFIFTVLKSFFKFINIYFLKLGFLDGKNGFIIALKMSQNVFWKYNALKKFYKKNASEPTFIKFSVSKKFDKKSEHVHA